MRDAIGDAGTPIYIAVLPAAGGRCVPVATRRGCPPTQRRAVGRPGTYGVIVGDSFRAGSTELPTGQAGELATDALDSGGDDTASVLVDFVELVGAAAASDGSGGSGGSNGSSRRQRQQHPAAGPAGRRRGGGRILGMAQQQEPPGGRRPSGPGRGGGPPDAARRAVGAGRRRGAAGTRGRAAPRGAERLRCRRQPVPGRPGGDGLRRPARRPRARRSAWSPRRATRWIGPGRSSKAASRHPRPRSCSGRAATVNRR